MSKFEMTTELRGRPLVRVGRLSAGQPVVLRPEPSNPYDANAVLCLDLLGKKRGYVAREDAPRVKLALETGRLLLAKVVTTLMVRPRAWPRLYIWEEGLSVDTDISCLEALLTSAGVLEPA